MTSAGAITAMIGCYSQHHISCEVFTNSLPQKQSLPILLLSATEAPGILLSLGMAAVLWFSRPLLVSGVSRSSSWDWLTITRDRLRLPLLLYYYYMELSRPYYYY